MKTILVKSPDDTDGVSLYRQWGPLAQLEKAGHVRLMKFPDDPKQITNWVLYERADLAMVGRPTSASDYYFIIQCEKHGLPVWVDIDDNLFLVPDDNPSFKFFSGKEFADHASYALSRCDVITVATVHLQKFVKEHFKRDAVLVPNAQPELHFKNRRGFKRNKNILWRGSASHMADLLYYENELITLVEALKSDGFKWLFMGMNPYWITRRIKDAPITWSLPMNHIDYMPQMRKNEPTFNFVAMVDREFNRTRSNNGWQETTLAGAVTFAPDWIEWTRNGIVNYQDRSDFIEKFRAFVNLSDKELQDLYNKSLQHVNENLLPKINRKRLEIINNL